MPSRSHSDDLARRRWTWSRRWSSALGGSSISFALAFGFALLKLSTTVENEPVVSLPMHHVTSPEALACVAFSAWGVPPLSSPPPPHPAIAKSALTTSAASIRGVFIIESSSSWASLQYSPYPLCGGVNPLADLLRHLVAEGREIVRLAARHEAVVHHDLL